MKIYSVLLLATFCSLSLATVWYVHPDSSLNSIEAALDSCVDHDTVLVGPGTYYENIVWPNKKGIDLISEFGADTTIIDGSDSGCVVVFNNQNIDTTTVIQGLTLQNGYDPYGGGIFCDSFTSPIIIQNTIRACTSSWCGGGILLLKASPYIIGNIISDNYADFMGGGICATYYSSLISMYNTVTRNTSNFEGGGVYLDNVNAKMLGDTISFNYSYVPGDGICCVYSLSPITIDSCVIAENIGTGIYGNFYSKLVIRYCSITDNSYYGVRNHFQNDTIDATHNWWGDSTGPYHPSLNPGGLGNPVSDRVDFIPWLCWPGIEERISLNPTVNQNIIGSTIFAGPLLLPEDQTCRVFDIAGRAVLPQHIKPGVYFIEVDGKIKQKVVKIR